MNAYKHKVKRACSSVEEISLVAPGRLQGWDCGSDYSVVRTVSENTLGPVAVGIEVSSKHPVYIKQFKNIFTSMIHCKKVLRELILLSRVNQPGLTRLVKVLLPSDPLDFSSLHVIVEHSKHSLKHLMESKKTLTLQEVTAIMWGLLQSLSELHRRDIIHRGLKPCNILVDPEDLSSVQLSDFSQARSVHGNNKSQILNRENDTGRSDSKRKLSSLVSSRNYRAPEVILVQADYGPSVDMWAVGCIFGELLSKLEEAPFAQMNLPLFSGSHSQSLTISKQNSDGKSGTKGALSLKMQMSGPSDLAQYRDDQILSILHIIGTPSDREMEHLGESAIVEYLEDLPEFPKQDFKTRFPGAPRQALDLIDELIQFAPSDRLTLEETLAHPFFSEMTKGRGDHPQVAPIKFEFEESKKLDFDILREHFLRELLRISEAAESTQ